MSITLDFTDLLGVWFIFGSTAFICGFLFTGSVLLAINTFGLNYHSKVTETKVIEDPTP
jgi:hypothetical protein